MGFLQVGLADVGINLGGSDRSMAQHLLYRAQIGAVLHEVRSKRMTQGVRRDGLINSRLLGRLADEALMSETIW